MALIYMTHTEPVHAMGDRGGAAARDHRELYAGHLQHLQAVAVARMKYFILTPGLVEVQAAVGEHAVAVDHQEAVDLRTVHDLRGLGGQYVRVYRLAVARHHLADTRAVHVELVIHRAAQVAVGEDAHHLARLVDHRRHAHALAADLEQGLAQYHLGRDRGHRRAAT